MPYNYNHKKYLWQILLYLFTNSKGKIPNLYTVSNYFHDKYI